MLINIHINPKGFWLMNNKGFTILEVLISLVILSMIAIVSSNILKSSLETEQETSLQLNSIKELNLASTIIRRDLRPVSYTHLTLPTKRIV